MKSYNGIICAPIFVTCILHNCTRIFQMRQDEIKSAFYKEVHLSHNILEKNFRKNRLSLLLSFIIIIIKLLSHNEKSEFKSDFYF